MRGKKIEPRDEHELVGIVIGIVSELEDLSSSEADLVIKLIPAFYARRQHVRVIEAAKE